MPLTHPTLYWHFKQTNTEFLFRVDNLSSGTELSSFFGKFWLQFTTFRPSGWGNWQARKIVEFNLKFQSPFVWRVGRGQMKFQFPINFSTWRRHEGHVTYVTPLTTNGKFCSNDDPIPSPFTEVRGVCTNPLISCSISIITSMFNFCPPFG